MSPFNQLRSMWRDELARTGGAQPQQVIFLGENARTADQDALRRAREMAARGADPETIWRDTGWFQGADRGWRYEIPDDQMTFTPQALDAIGNRQPIQNQTLGNVVEHDQLYAAHPGMRNIPLSIQDRPNAVAAGMYGPDGSGIEVNDPMRARGVAAHEMQHAIDAQMAGFGYGRTPNAPGQPGTCSTSSAVTP